MTFNRNQPPDPTPDQFEDVITDIGIGWPVVAFDKAASSAGCPTRTIALYGLPPEIITQAQSLRGGA